MLIHSDDTIVQQVLHVILIIITAIDCDYFPPAWQWHWLSGGRTGDVVLCT